MNTQAILTPEGLIKDDVVDVTLLGYKDMQTNFLSTLINNELNMRCEIQSYSNSESYQDMILGQLTLVDCKYVPLDDIDLFFDSKCSDSSRVALINVQTNEDYEKLALWPQVKGMFYETVKQDVLISGLKVLLNGGDWLPRHVMQRLIDEYRSAPKRPRNNVKLTRREQQILKMLLDGSTNLQIAEVLEVSEYTIKSHLYNVFKKIDVKNRIQAYNWAQLHLSDG
ncbi:LuxR C-terminal-related transcriptional regulator [Aestuariicella sp. G3-2]|uniref:LuxR C-terminal-related transcriptional regulator n=1 Tax=Pseudomaricurvus albidus TaxID=2842452 RepID=UPI001C0C0CC9|nr:LuxR C-terminal-related transcriptional regulator [Aestuariicella albida]MBU3071105.1 LuxR C-terminal-related transcriptional regulator [Aestuariicella albida]